MCLPHRNRCLLVACESRMLRAFIDPGQTPDRARTASPGLHASTGCLIGRRGLYAENPSRRHTAPVRWRHWQRYRRGQLPPALRPWLLAEGSLTRHLTEAAGGDFRVQLLRQGWQRPTLAERQLLGLDVRALALVREVVLWGAGQPWVYGRSIIPNDSLSGELRRLKKLRDSSLGSLLFRYPQLSRTPFELAAIDGASQLPPALRCDARLWARRSRFALDGRALVVSETFLPAFQPRRAPRQSLTGR